MKSKGIPHGDDWGMPPWGGILSMKQEDILSYPREYTSASWFRAWNVEMNFYKLLRGDITLDLCIKKEANWMIFKFAQVFQEFYKVNMNEG